MSSEEEAKKHSIEDITDETLLHIISYIGMLERSKSVVGVNKAFARACGELLQYHGDQVLGGHLLESQGRTFSPILDALRYATLELKLISVSARARQIIKGTNDLHTLRQVGLHEDLQCMNVAVYTYWDKTPGDSKFGIINWFEEAVEINPGLDWHEPLENDVRFFKQDRVFDNFTLLFDTPSGAILVSDDFQRVYLTLGIRDSMGHVVGFQTPYSQFSRLIGYPVAATLLPWEGKVVYDGLLGTPRQQVKKKVLKRALRAFIHAVDSNTLITTLPRKPLERPPPSTSKRAKAGSASTSTSSSSGHTGGSIPGGIDVSALKVRLQSKISSIASMRKYTSNPQKPSTWVFRRYGYTRRENPNFIVTVLGASGEIINPFSSFKALEPTPEEIVNLLQTCCNSVGGRKPDMIFVDAESVVAPLQELLRGLVDVGYYPPPSPEEAQWHSGTGADSTKHGLSAQDRKCARCGALRSPDGHSLMKCSRCCKIYYCCREHQKEHWKFHKHECSP